MVPGLFQDLKHSARMLCKNPGFTCVAIVSIAIGVGANAAMFSMADALVLRPLPVPRPGEVDHGCRRASCARTSQPVDVLSRLRRRSRRGSQLRTPRGLSARRRGVRDRAGRIGATEGGRSGQREPARGQRGHSATGTLVPGGREPGGRAKSGRRSGVRHLDGAVRRRPRRRSIDACSSRASTSR